MEQSQEATTPKAASQPNEVTTESIETSAQEATRLLRNRLYGAVVPPMLSVSGFVAEWQDIIDCWDPPAGAG